MRDDFKVRRARTGEAGEPRARAPGISTVTLCTDERMGPNQRLNVAVGYEETRRRPEDGLSRVDFRAPLGQATADDSRVLPCS